MSHLSQRLIVNVFVSAHVVLLPDRASFDSRESTSLNHRLAVMTTLAGDLNLYRRDLDAHNVFQQLAAHRLRKLYKRLLLFRASALIDDHDGLRRIRIVVLIAERSVSLDGCYHAQSVERHS